MANTIMTAKNTFGAGLIMDFAPDNTLADRLTNALNATLLTFNGNEMSLLNDMGNGRVETAFLPEGYVPVGTTSFGGIIYIVSYNPLNDKCQIGCFPSPERNITKDEESDLESVLNSKFFIDEDFKVTNLTLKVIIKNDNLNPGDKYCVFIDRKSNKYNSMELDSITGLFKDSAPNDRHKRISLKVVSIDDSGQITDLDTQIYKVNIEGDTGTYHIPTSFINDSSFGKADLDSYRKLMKEKYSVFSSKVPGKLAILAELEAIKEFSCGHRIVAREVKGDPTASSLMDKEDHITYDVYIAYSWKSDYDDIIPEYIMASDMKWEFTIDNPAKEIWGASTQMQGYDSKIRILSSTSLTDCKYSYTADEKDVLLLLPKLDISPVDGNPTYNYHKVTKQLLPLDDYIFDCAYTDSFLERKVRLKNTKTESFETFSTKTDISDEILNNKFNTNSEFLLCSFNIPKYLKSTNKKDRLYDLPLKLTYTITPAMDYGTLDYLAETNTIDFSMINHESIETVGFKYFVSDDLLTIDIDSEIYEKEGYKVSSIDVEFYDLNGFCGSYNISNRSTYNGNFSINLLTGVRSLQIKKSTDPDNSYRFHYYLDNYETLEVGSNLLITKTQNEIDKAGGILNLLEENNDIGVIFKSRLYLARVVYNYSELDPITLNFYYNSNGKILPESTLRISKYFWVYTNGQFNEFYYTHDMFDILSPEIPIGWDLELKDCTKKETPYISNIIPKGKLNSSEDYFKALLNPEEYLDMEDDEVVRTDNGNTLNLKTKVKYKGNLQADVTLGILSNDMFVLNGAYDLSSLANIELKLSSSDGTKTSEMLSNQKDSEDNLISLDETTSTISIKGDTTPKFYETNEGHLDLYVNIDTDFTTTINSISTQITGAKVLTPILFDNDYESIGVSTPEPNDYLFDKALVINTSDDTIVSNENTWPSGWFTAYLNYNDKKLWTISDNISLYSANLIPDMTRNLSYGRAEVADYFSSLGNRLPISLFTVLSGLSIWSTKGMTANEFLTNNVMYNSSNKPYIKTSKYYENRGTINIDCNASNKNDVKRFLLPLLVTARNAKGGYNICMTSQGGTYQSGVDGYPYTSISSHKISDLFVKYYVQTMKLISSINPDIDNISINRGVILQESLVDKVLNSYLIMRVNFSKDVNWGDLILLDTRATFNSYIEYTISRCPGAEQVKKKLKDSKNVLLSLNSENCGNTEEGTPIRQILYTIPHEHEEIVNYNDGIDITVYKESSAGKNILITGQIDPTKFYVHNKKEAKDMFYQLRTGSFTNSYGKISPFNSQNIDGNVDNGLIYEIKRHSSKISYDVKYSSVGSSSERVAQPLFYNTNFIVEDFIWDTSNSDHHMYFISENVCKTVKNEASYLLDDDGDKMVSGVNESGRFYYLIGPSFDWLSKA